MGDWLSPRYDKKWEALSQLPRDKSMTDLWMNPLIIQLLGQKPGFVIIFAVTSSVSTLNDRNVSVDLSLFRGIRQLTLTESMFGTPLSRMYCLIISVVVFVENLVT